MKQQQAPAALPVLRGELALAVVVVINSFGVVLMLHSGSGISAISSVPYAFSAVFPAVSLGTWTYLFQALLIAGLMVLRKKLVVPYLFSFAVGFVFSRLLDFYEGWVYRLLPTALGLRVAYFFVSYFLMCLGIALSNRCGLPVIPTDLFPRELAAITGWPYARVKIGFDVTCLCTTALVTFLGLGRIQGLGIGTVAAAFTMGKTISLIGAWLDRHVRFESVLSRAR